MSIFSHYLKSKILLKAYLMLILSFEYDSISSNLRAIMRTQVEQWLQKNLGQKAQFRDGQWEAIEALVDKRQRVLVVQRTGWGKSLVYFMATRLLRKQGAGLTVLISPLLSLMRNQVDAARQWGLNVYTINSSNAAEHLRIENAVRANQVDLLLISPERLANERFQNGIWRKLKHQIGLLVIDEAHCISDWGHDFRPNYRRIMHILDELPQNTPVLGTTATANDRVVEDVAEILGATMNIQRGTLTRESLSLYVYPEIMDNATRLTLLSHLLKSIPGSGIIYCTTTRDCMMVAEWLQAEGHKVKAYFANVEAKTGENREVLEKQLLNNQVKALVSSVALGMGFDKGDLHFVIHYQMPSNIISYYQQIGRAGRSIDKAYIVLMHGSEDEEIQQYFIDTAFPTQKQVNQVIDALLINGATSRFDLEQFVNVRRSVLERILIHLEVEEIIEKRDREYHLLSETISPDYARWQEVTQIRYKELNQMKSYFQEKDCLMRFIALALDDPRPVERCGQCKNCKDSESKFQPSIHAIEQARFFLRDGKPIEFEPRKQYPRGFPDVSKLTIQHKNETGLALCGFYEEGWGTLVREGRSKNQYSDELITASVDTIKQYWQTTNERPQIVVSIPSLRRPKLVSDFAQDLAKALGLPYQGALKHVEQHPPQSEMRNSYQQATNMLNRFEVITQLRGESILLVDDIADSKWTLTMVGKLLQEQGSSAIYPFVLAVTNT